MNTLSKKQKTIKIEKQAKHLQDNKHWQLHCAHRDKRKTTPWDMLDYILPRYVLQNFLLFRAAVTDCALGKIHNNLDFWIYACRYLLMDDTEFVHCGYGPNGKNFSYKV